MFKSFVQGLHRQFKGEIEIKRFLTILHRGKEGKKRGREGRLEVRREGMNLQRKRGNLVAGAATVSL